MLVCTCSVAFSLTRLSARLACIAFMSSAMSPPGSCHLDNYVVAEDVTGRDFVLEPLTQHYPKDTRVHTWIPHDMMYTFSLTRQTDFSRGWTNWVHARKLEHSNCLSLWGAMMKNVNKDMHSIVGADYSTHLRNMRLAEVDHTAKMFQSVLEMYVFNVYQMKTHIFAEQVELDLAQGLYHYHALIDFYRDRCVYHQCLQFIPGLTKSIINGDLKIHPICQVDLNKVEAQHETPHFRSADGSWAPSTTPVFTCDGDTPSLGGTCDGETDGQPFGLGSGRSSKRRRTQASPDRNGAIGAAMVSARPSG